MKWLLDNIPWVFSGAGVAIILGVVSLLRARGWFRNPLKHLEVRPIPDFSQIPNLADGPARFHFALRVTNTHLMPVFISAIQAQLRVPPDGHRAIAPTYVTTSTAARVSFPARLDGNSTHDFVVALPVADNTIHALHCNLELHTSTPKRTGDVAIEVYRDAEETQVFVTWMGGQAVFGSTRIPQGTQTVEVKFRKKLKAPPSVIEGRLQQDEQKGA